MTMHPDDVGRALDRARQHVEAAFNILSDLRTHDLRADDLSREAAELHAHISDLWRAPELGVWPQMRERERRAA